MLQVEAQRCVHEKVSFVTFLGGFVVVEQNKWWVTITLQQIVVVCNLSRVQIVRTLRNNIISFTVSARIFQLNLTGFFQQLVDPAH